MGGPSNKHTPMRTMIKGTAQMANPTVSPPPSPPHLQNHEVGSPRLPPAPIRRGHLTALQAIRESPHLRAKSRVGVYLDRDRNEDRMVSAGALAQAHPAIVTSVVISKFPLIGRVNPPEKPDSRSPSMVLPTHPGKVFSSPTQVRPLPSFS